MHRYAWFSRFDEIIIFKIIIRIFFLSETTFRAFWEHGCVASRGLRIKRFKRARAKLMEELTVWAIVCRSQKGVCIIHNGRKVLLRAEERNTALATNVIATGPHRFPLLTLGDSRLKSREVCINPALSLRFHKNSLLSWKVSKASRDSRLKFWSFWNLKKIWFEWRNEEWSMEFLASKKKKGKVLDLLEKLKKFETIRYYSRFLSFPYT